MNWPGDREPFIVHVAAEPADEADKPGSVFVRLTQRCGRCRLVLHRGGDAAPWACGARVAVSQSGQVRMQVNGTVPFPDCEQAVREPVSVAA